MSLRDDFPILNTQVNGHPLVYLDNAATLQPPRQVLDAVGELYAGYNGNVHRAGHALGRETSRRMEQARERVQGFLNAEAPEEIVFTAGTTDSINLLSRFYAEQVLRPGDEVLVTQLEHHSNLLPWAAACQRTGAVLRMVPMDEAGDLDLAAFRSLLCEKTRLVALCYVSNAIGTVNPVERMISAAHAAGAAVLLDAAQAVLHRTVDVQALGCDFLAFSGHKIGALTGVGVLYGRKSAWERLEPVRSGGGMVRAVRGTQAEYAALPHRFEPGTPNYAGIISLGAAVEYLEQQGRQELSIRSKALLDRAEEILRRPGIRILGAPRERAGAISFTAEQIHAYDLAQMLDQQGVAVRSGHHCAQNAVEALGASHTVRLSPAFYNTPEDLSRFEEALERAIHSLRNH